MSMKLARYRMTEQNHKQRFLSKPEIRACTWIWIWTRKGFQIAD
jgi:hypothetical protein